MLAGQNQNLLVAFGCRHPSLAIAVMASQAASAKRTDSDAPDIEDTAAGTVNDDQKRRTPLPTTSTDAGRVCRSSRFDDVDFVTEMRHAHVSVE